MEMINLVCVEWCSCERAKYIWEDFGGSSTWDEIIGRMYLLKAHDIAEDGDYEEALVAFEAALKLLPQDGFRRDYYYKALADKALILCFLEQYEAGLALYDEALALAATDYRSGDWMINNRGAILVLTGAFSEALDLLQARLALAPKNDCLRFTLATCLLHLERYDEAVAAYKQANFVAHPEGLEAARRRQQPDWDDL
jgi:tetratricopeptide (TPR) repeat protein